MLKNITQNKAKKQTEKIIISTPKINRKKLILVRYEVNTNKLFIDTQCENQTYEYTRRNNGICVYSSWLEIYLDDSKATSCAHNACLTGKL
jgi:hypothetical protein